MSFRQKQPASDQAKDIFHPENSREVALPGGWGGFEDDEYEVAAAENGAQWYAIRTRTKGEHIAAAQLKQLDGVETFCPRIRFQKTTRRGQVWFVEALFPGYVFARFNATERMRLVNSTASVTGAVQFGTEYPTISGQAMMDMRSVFHDERELRVIQPGYSAGDEVEIMTGPLRGLQALVTRAMPGAERIAILMEWLGGEHEAEVSVRDVSRTIGDTPSTGDSVRLAAGWN